MNPSIADKKVVVDKAEHPATTCINCNACVEGNFCASCGQRTLVKEITWQNLFQELTTTWFGFDNKFSRTFHHLTVSPGKLVNSYLLGNRVTYLSPLGYYFIVSALVLLVLSMIDVDMEEFVKSSGTSLNEYQKPGSKGLQMQQQVLHAMSQMFRFMVIVFVPFFALAAALLYKSKGLNFLQHSVLLIYSSGHLFWITLLQGLALKFSGEIYTTASIIITMLYYGHFYQSALEERKGIGKFIKGLAVLVVGYIFFLLFIAMILLLVIALANLLKYMGFR